MTCFVAVHTSSIVLCGALHHLVHNPATAALLRQEALTTTAAAAGQKSIITDLPLLDGFVHECMRDCRQNLLTLRRTVVGRKGYRFADGSWFPQGATVGLPVYFIHHDKRIYENPAEFDVMRWVAPAPAPAPAGGEGRVGNKPADLVTPSKTFLGFGFGKHVWYVPFSPSTPK